MVLSKNWIVQTTDEIVKHITKLRGPDSKIVCASGISPSGTIHLGNLREVMTVHLVSEELKYRGLNAIHLHSWDDFDRLRKIPSNVPPEFSAHIGKPLSDVPDPFGEYDSYATRHIKEFENALAVLGISPQYIRQSQAYRSGDYVEKIKIAISRRFDIFDILVQYQTLEKERSIEDRRDEYYPFRVYCENCNKDNTQIVKYENDNSVIHYRCNNCGYNGNFSLDDKVPGKLSWKVDWPMRWSYAGVDFEPAGEDHSAPGSSFTVGQQIVREIFDGHPPYFIGYAFVGMSGRSKISSSVGTSVSPKAALDILEPSILRWLYIRRRVDQKFNIDFGQEVLRLYDEWDTFSSKVKAGNITQEDKRLFERCIQTSSGAINQATLPISFRLLSSAADITQGNTNQILRIVSDHLESSPPKDILGKQLEPRLTCAINWATQYLPVDECTVINPCFNSSIYSSLDDRTKQGIQILLDKLDDNWSLQGLTQLVYGIPKLLLGLSFETGPTPEVKIAQRNFFASIYRLICSNETGPRLPTLFLSLGKERVRELLTRGNGKQKIA